MNSKLSVSMFATLSGLLLFASDYPINAWFLHFVALVPLFIGLRFVRQLRFRVGYALCFALSYCLPLILFAGTAVPVVVAAGVALFEWLAILTILGALVSKSSVADAWLAASTICVFELILWHGFPIFGTAQCFARVTSATPMFIQFAAHTGLIGVVFVLVASQYLLADLAAVLIQSRLQYRSRLTSTEVESDESRSASKDWRACAVALAGLLLLVTLLNSMRWNRPLGKGVRVAAASWFGAMELSLRDLCAKARETKADVVVTPETAFSLRKQFADKDRDSIAADIREFGVLAAIGAFRADIRTNQSLLIEPNGQVVGVYEKSHLIPWMENYNAGKSEIVQAMYNEITFGTMICQDDNFTDLGRSHSYRGTQVMLVPTNDWEPIRGYHFENSRVRAIEFGYAIVRATTNGISAVISPRGELLSAVDHTLEPGILTANGEVLAGDGVPTIYARYGDWLIGLPSMVVFLVTLVAREPSITRWRRNDDRSMEAT